MGDLFRFKYLLIFEELIVLPVLRGEGRISRLMATSKVSMFSEMASCLGEGSRGGTVVMGNIRGEKGEKEGIIEGEKGGKVGTCSTNRNGNGVCTGGER